MIILCHHLREAGLMNECCPHCHILAGCCGFTLPNDHQAIACCGRIEPFTPEEIETIMAKIPEWEQQEALSPLQIEPAVVTIPKRFRPAYQALQRLEGNERYLAAFIPGPMARGEATKRNNLTVQVIVNEKKSCQNRSYPTISGIKLNLTFLSMEQYEKGIMNEIDHYSLMVKSALEDDPLTALLVMDMSLLTLLMYHYEVHQKWWVPPSRLLANLGKWDLKMEELVKNFLDASEVHIKYLWWSAMIDHIQQPLGTYQPIAEESCLCSTCKRDVAVLMEE